MRHIWWFSLGICEVRFSNTIWISFCVNEWFAWPSWHISTFSHVMPHPICFVPSVQKVASFLLSLNKLMFWHENSQMSNYWPRNGFSEFRKQSKRGGVKEELQTFSLASVEEEAARISGSEMSKGIKSKFEPFFPQRVEKLKWIFD